MIASIRKFTFFLTACLLASSAMHAAEQDNWYLANEWSRTQSAGVFHYMDQNTGSEHIYVARADSTAEIYVYEMNGTLERKFGIGNSDYYAYDLALDANGTIFIAERHGVACLENDGTFKWRIGKNTSISSYGSTGFGDGEFYYAYGIAIHPVSGELFVADKNNHRIQVLDKNGSFIRKFGSNGTAPGQLREPHDLVFLPNGTLIVGDHYYLHYFEPDGTFIKRINNSSAERYVSSARDGTLFCNGKLRDQDGNVLANGPFGSRRSCFTTEGDLIESQGDKIRIWKRAYRTKGLPVATSSPACRSGHHPAGGDQYHRFGFRNHRSGRCQCNRGYPRRSGRRLYRYLQMDSSPNLGGWHRIQDRDPHRDQPGPPGILECQAGLARQHGHPQVRDHLSRRPSDGWSICTFSPSSSRRQPDH